MEKSIKRQTKIKMAKKSRRKGEKHDKQLKKNFETSKEKKIFKNRKIQKYRKNPAVGKSGTWRDLRDPAGL